MGTYVACVAFARTSSDAGKMFSKMYWPKVGRRNEMGKMSAVASESERI